MSKRIDFFTMDLEINGKLTNYCVRDLLKNICQEMLQSNKGKNLVRKIDEKRIRMFPHYFEDRKQFIIPFGKYKDSNKPYRLDEDEKLVEIDNDLYDVNCLGYDSDYNVALYTTNNNGPRIKTVEEYLNTFIPENLGYRLRISPIEYNNGIERVRKAELVKSITVNLDLGYSLNNFFAKKIEKNQRGTLADSVKRMANAAKEEGEGRTLAIKLGLGQGRRKADTLDRDSILELLNEINIEGDFVKEIIVNYKDGEDEKIDTARIKDSNVRLTYTCTCAGSQVRPEELLENINKATSDKVPLINAYEKTHRRNMVPCSIEEIKIVKKWEEN